MPEQTLVWLLPGDCGDQHLTDHIYASARSSKEVKAVMTFGGSIHPTYRGMGIGRRSYGAPSVAQRDALLELSARVDLPAAR